MPAADSAAGPVPRGGGRRNSAISRADAWRLGLLVLLPLLVYARLVMAGFVWDDDTTLTANSLVRAGDGLWRIWFTSQATDYWPVTFSSFWAEWRIWGPWAPGYHVTNVLLHAIEGVLLWRLLLRLEFPGAYFAALWFSLHPLNVESVAWIAERKNLLAMLFFLLSLRSFAESSAVESGRVDRWCGFAWAAFVLSLLSKGSTATLPLVLAGWVLWRRRLSRKDALWLGPFCLAAAVMAAVNVWFSHKSGGAVIRDIGWPARFAGAGNAVWFYLGKALWPVRLCLVYPQWTVDARNPLWWLGFGSAVILTIALWLGRKHGTKPELWAWLYFVGMLVPALGFADVYFMRYSLIADRYAHLALIGVVAWAAARFVQLRLPRYLAVSVALVLAGLTFRQAGNYRDSFALFRSVLAINPGCWMARYNLGVGYGERGDAAAAISQYREALRLKPNFAEAHNNLGTALSAMPGRLPEAIAQFEAALRLKPDFAAAHCNLGGALGAEGRTRDAIVQYEEALRLKPDLAEAHNYLGNAWLTTPGRLPEAIAELREALRLKPDYPEAHDNLGSAWSQMPGHVDDAIAEYEEALRLKPDLAEAHYNLGNAFADLPGRLDDAIDEYRAALRLKPDFAEAHNNLGSTWMKMPGHLSNALAEYEEASRLRPDIAAIHLNLALALLHDPGRAAEALVELETVLRLQPGNTVARRILDRIGRDPPGT